MKQAHVRALTLLFLGALLMQAAWVLAIPPFRGIDEVDHAYRAAAVANGQWFPPTAAENGRGHLVVVPESIALAAGPECRALKYMGRDNCTPVQKLENDDVAIASAAARYHPAFYWIVGTPSQLFDGAKALYAMRIAAALLCAGFIAFSSGILFLWARTRWPFVSMLVALTPVTIYSTAMPAPNGIELCASIALWVAMLGLTRPHISTTTERALLWAALPSALVLATVRSFGPVWLGLIVLTVIALLGVKKTVSLVKRQRGPVSIIATLVAAATVAGASWTILAGANELEQQLGLEDPWANTLKHAPLWFFQSIAAFPTRNEQAPAVLYAAFFVVLLAMVSLGYWMTGRKLRSGIAGTLFVALLVPVLATVTTYSQVGPIWQGRYGLPYAFGVILLAGLALEQSRVEHRLVGPALVSACLAMSVAHVVGVTNVLVLERANSPSAGGPDWLMPAPWLVALLMALGWLAWGLALRQQSRLLLTGAVEAPEVREEHSVSA